MNLKFIKEVIKKIISKSFPHYRRLHERAINFEKTCLVLESALKGLREEYEKKGLLITDIYNQYLNMKLKYENPAPGTEDWLVLAEFRYGGTVDNIIIKKASVFDPRTKEELSNYRMMGGDRMSQIEHNYAPIYAQFLQHFLKKQNVVLAEVGILKGTGVAIWSELFKSGRILGLDIDLSNIRSNMEWLKDRGAFINNNLELYEFDQFVDNRKMLKTILNESKVNIVIDDGIHRDDAILKTLASFLPHLADEFLYIIEDNFTAHDKIANLYPDLQIKNHGEITIIWNYI